MLALATERFVGREGLVQELLSDDLEGVTPPPRVEHVAREHRVGHQTAQCHAGAAQHQKIVLRVLRHLRDAGVLEQRAEGRHRGVVERWQVLDRRYARGERPGSDARRLCGLRRPGALGAWLLRPRFVGLVCIAARLRFDLRAVAEQEVPLCWLERPVSERQVERFARPHGDRDTHQGRAQWVHLLWAVRLDHRLAVEGDVRCLPRARDHALQRRDGIHGDVARRGTCDLRRRLRRPERGGGGERRRGVAERPGERMEFELHEQLSQPRGIRLPDTHLLELQGDRKIFANRY